ncbi:MAG: DsrE family protein [Deltaproteobacteria bacterium]|nr:DsrE family protein [Deltaproteobacteria bacterium]
MKPESEKQVKIRVVFHLDADEGKRLVMALNNIGNLLKEIPPAQASICLVANGSAVKLFHRDYAADENVRVKELAGKGVHFLMCNNSLNNFNIDPRELVAGCTVTKAGVLELIERQADGYAYIKP